LAINATRSDATGPLAGIRVLEMGGIGPGPHCGMILGDLGADVVRIERAGPVPGNQKFDLLNRNKRCIALNLKLPDDLALARAMIDKADLLIEGFRPGVMEKLGLGPDVFETSNPRLVYGRMTGWGQQGPLAQAAGHDINYIALTGALHAIGPKDGKPSVPLNLIGDFGGGSLYLAVGLLAALHEARASGRGQVVDCAIVDGVNSLLAMQMGMLQSGAFSPERGINLLDGGAPFYDVYETKDGLFVSIGPVEPQFYNLFLELTGLDQENLPAQQDKASWPLLKQRFTDLFAMRTRAEWCNLLEGTDACFAPVLDFEEARAHPHNRARGAVRNVFGLNQPQPAPLFSRTPGGIRSAPAIAGGDNIEVLSDWSPNQEPGR